MSRLQAIVGKLKQPLTFAQHLLARQANRSAENAAAQLISDLFSVAESGFALDSVPQKVVHDINHIDAVEFVKSLKPDAILVNGTNLLREPWHSWAADVRHGIINIHTGLSPYSRGGNCNLFSILHGQLQCVGVTVHYIDAGIDSGDIIYTDRPTIRPDDSYESIEAKVFRLGEDLAALALRQLDAGENIPRVSQWTKGREFLKRTGYQYSPGQRVLANRRLHDQGLLDIYLRFQDQLNATARVIAPTADNSLWRHRAV